MSKYQSYSYKCVCKELCGMEKHARRVLYLSALAASLNGLDVLTTWMGITHGLHEANPTAAAMIATGSFVLYAAVKLVYSLGILLFGVLFSLRVSDYSKPVKLICVLVLLVLSAYFGVTVLQNVSLLG